MQEFNGFDNIGNPMSKEEADKASEKQRQEVENYTNLVHRVFKQSEDGQALLKIWVDMLMFVPSIQPSSTQFEAGIEEGKKEFTRLILRSIKQVEES